MYNNYQIPTNFTNGNNSRFVGGGFLGPFLLGGITVGLVSPLFYGGYNRPYYYNNYYYPTYQPYPYYYTRPY